MNTERKAAGEFQYLIIGGTTKALRHRYSHIYLTILRSVVHHIRKLASSSVQIIHYLQNTDTMVMLEYTIYYSQIVRMTKLDLNRHLTISIVHLPYEDIRIAARCKVGV